MALDDQKEEIVRIQRYPYGNRLFIIDLLTLVAGVCLFLAIPLGNLPGSEFSIVVLGPLILGGALTYLPRGVQLAKLNKPEGDTQYTVKLRVEGHKDIRRRAIKNVMVIMLALIIPVALLFILSPILWVLLILSSFLSFVVGRLTFFFRVRLWEIRRNSYLQSYVSRVENMDGSRSFVQGILVAKQVSRLAPKA